MAGKSLEQRLAALKEKKDSLAEQIKKIETEHSRQLRKDRQERARIIGMAILRKVEAGQWSDGYLLELVSTFIISGKERRLLGLSSKEFITSDSKANISSVQSQPPESSRQSHAISPIDSSSGNGKRKEPDRNTKRSRLHESNDEAALMQEFNI